MPAVKNQTANPKPPVLNSSAGGSTSSARDAEPVSIRSNLSTPKAAKAQNMSSETSTQSRFVNNNNSAGDHTSSARDAEPVPIHSDLPTPKAAKAQNKSSERQRIHPL